MDWHTVLNLSKGNKGQRILTELVWFATQKATPQFADIKSASGHRKSSETFSYFERVAQFIMMIFP